MFITKKDHSQSITGKNKFDTLNFDWYYYLSLLHFSLINIHWSLQKHNNPKVVIESQS